MRTLASIRGCGVLSFAAIVLVAALMPREAGAVNAVDYAVRASAVTQKNPPRVTITWTADPDADSYVVKRKAKDATAWGSGTTLSGGATSFVDNNVAVGGAYEYMIQKNASEGSSYYTGYGYVFAGIDAPMIDNRGKLLLIVESTYASNLATEINRLIQDMVGDGWTVIRRDVSRTQSIQSVKQLIQAECNADPGNVKQVFLLGRVPVPYSGLNNPDGHSDHRGAWPADSWYGDMNGTWTDSTVNITSSARPENRNIPGDGKFDQTQIPSDIELAIGRVDLYNMPAFGQSEEQLLRRYLNKDHNFRHGNISAQRRGLVDDHFGVHSSGGAFAQNGWRNFAAFFGANNTYQLDWFSTLPNNTYLWAYATGGGTYTSAWGIGSTQDFANTDPKVVFTMVFGSYFFDWDCQNNFMRAPLCTQTMGLSSSWGCWPHHFYHHMALGETLGYGIRLSINNGGLYPTSKARGSYVALMGDPTLRMHPVKPASNLLGGGEAGNVQLNWSASADSNIVGYHVYRGTNAQGPFTRLTGSLVTGTTYTDGTAQPTTYIYMVRAVKLESAASGTYFNPAVGVFRTVNVGGEPPPPPPPPPQHDTIVVEVEQFSSKTDRSNCVWSLTTAYSGYSANGAMRASPNSGINIDTNVPATSPVLNYSLNFANATTYYLWVRGCGQTAGDDSLHAGLNNAIQTSCSRISNYLPTWQWSRSTMAGPDATVIIPSQGTHNFNLWMREDGFVADKFILTTDPDYVPTGTGPAANQGGSGGGGTNQPPVILSEATANPNPALVGQSIAFAVSASDPDGDALSYSWNMGDGTTRNGPAVTHNYNTTGSFTVTVTVSDGRGGTAQDSLQVSSVAYLQNSGGLLSIEAENYANKVALSGHDWTGTSLSGQSGGALRATPDNNTTIDNNVASTSPRLDYRVKFNRTGTHYVWIRGAGDGGDDSCHVGLSGVLPSTGNRLSNFNTSWKWSKSTMDGPVATINVPTTGVYTVNVWMREDGLRIDKLVVTSDPNYTPTGTGPAESALGE